MTTAKDIKSGDTFTFRSTTYTAQGVSVDSYGTIMVWIDSDNPFISSAFASFNPDDKVTLINSGI